MLLKDFLNIYTGATLEDLANAMETVKAGKNVQTKSVSKLTVKEHKVKSNKEMSYIEITQQEMIDDPAILEKVDMTNVKGIKYNFEKERLEFYSL